MGNCAAEQSELCCGSITAACVTESNCGLNVLYLYTCQWYCQFVIGRNCSESQRPCTAFIWRPRYQLGELKGMYGIVYAQQIAFTSVHSLIHDIN